MFPYTLLVRYCAGSVGIAVKLTFESRSSARRRQGTSLGTEVSNSVIITGFYDFNSRNSNGLSTCQVVVSNSRRLGATKINIVVTLFAVGEEMKLYR